MTSNQSFGLELKKQPNLEAAFDIFASIDN